MSENTLNVTPEFQKTLEEDINKFVTDVISAFKAFVEAIKEFVRKVAPLVKKVVNLYFEIFKYPNKRVLHLALHSKSKKTRNKNIHRIQKWLKARCKI